MTDPVPHDEQLLAELRALGRLDGPPPHLVAAAQGLFTWRNIDEELAELTYESSPADRQLVGVRGTGAPVFLTFEAASLMVELEVIKDGRRRRVVGQVIPTQRGHVEFRHPSGSTTVEADQLGRFSSGDLPSGPISLSFRTASGTIVSTDWVLM